MRVEGTHQDSGNNSNPIIQQAQHCLKQAKQDFQSFLSQSDVPQLLGDFTQCAKKLGQPPQVIALSQALHGCVTMIVDDHSSPPQFNQVFQQILDNFSSRLTSPPSQPLSFNLDTSFQMYSMTQTLASGEEIKTAALNSLMPHTPTTLNEDLFSCSLHLVQLFQDTPSHREISSEVLNAFVPQDQLTHVKPLYNMHQVYQTFSYLTNTWAKIKNPSSTDWQNAATRLDQLSQLLKNQTTSPQPFFSACINALLTYAKTKHPDKTFFVPILAPLNTCISSLKTKPTTMPNLALLQANQEETKNFAKDVKSKPTQVLNYWWGQIQFNHVAPPSNPPDHLFYDLGKLFGDAYGGLQKYNPDFPLEKKATPAETALFSALFTALGTLKTYG